MAQQFEARPGNYLAFFSSFDYLQQVADGFRGRLPAHRDVGARRAAWTRPNASGFSARFVPDGAGHRLRGARRLVRRGHRPAGTRLVGAFVATLGLPQFNPVNEEMRRRIDEVFGAGYDYAYLFPGIRKVVQAAGRVIRSPPTAAPCT